MHRIPRHAAHRNGALLIAVAGGVLCARRGIVAVTAALPPPSASTAAAHPRAVVKGAPAHAGPMRRITVTPLLPPQFDTTQRRLASTAGTDSADASTKGEAEKKTEEKTEKKMEGQDAEPKSGRCSECGNETIDADPESDDLYRRLGLGRDATKAEIKHRYRVLADRHFLGQHCSMKSLRTLKRLKQAKEVLKDRQQRCRYDADGTIEKPSWENYCGNGMCSKGCWGRGGGYGGGCHGYGRGGHGWGCGRGCGRGGRKCFKGFLAFVVVMALPGVLLWQASDDEGSAVPCLLFRFAALLAVVMVLPAVPAAAAIFYMSIVADRKDCNKSAICSGNSNGCSAVTSNGADDCDVKRGCGFKCGWRRHCHFQWKRKADIIVTPTAAGPDTTAAVPHSVGFTNVPVDVAAVHKVTVAAKIVKPSADSSELAVAVPSAAVLVESAVGAASVALPADLFTTTAADGTVTPRDLSAGEELHAVVALRDADGRTTLEKTLTLPAVQCL